MTLTAEPEQDRLEWLEWRRQGLGSTDIAAILGLSPWASAWSVWAEKTGRVDLEADAASDEITAEFGRRAEPMLGPWFADLTGLTVGDPQTRSEYAGWPVARATTDYLVRPAPSAPVRGPLELKTTGWQAPWTPATFPPHYLCQVQWQMAVRGEVEAWVAALHGRRLHVYPMEADLGDAAFMLERAEQFWTHHVLGDRPPDIDGHPATGWALSELRRPIPTTLLDAAAADNAIRAYQHAADLARRAEADRKAAANALVAMLGEAEAGEVDVIDPVTGAAHRRTVVLYPLRERAGYTVQPTTYRQLVVPKQKARRR